MDQFDNTPANPATNAAETTEDNEANDSEAAIPGCKHGATNYTVAELTLLTKCMRAAVPIGPSAVENAFKTYNRVAGEKGWSERGSRALRQKWEKVGYSYHDPVDSGLTANFKLQHTREGWR